MKKLRIYLISILVSLVLIIIVLTIFLSFKYINDLSDLYFKEPEVAKEKEITPQEIDQAIEKLRRFRIIE